MEKGKRKPDTLGFGVVHDLRDFVKGKRVFTGVVFENTAVHTAAFPFMGIREERRVFFVGVAFAFTCSDGKFK